MICSACEGSLCVYCGGPDEDYHTMCSDCQHCLGTGQEPEDEVAAAIEFYRQEIKTRTGMDLADFAAQTVGTFEDCVDELRTWAEPWERVICLVALEESIDRRAEAG